MAMDLSNFKILKEDNDSYEIGHPSGKKLTVSKAGLSDKAHAAIKRYADGGEVSKDAIDKFVNNSSQSMQQADPPEEDAAPQSLSDAFNAAASNTAQMNSDETASPSQAAAAAPSSGGGEIGPNAQAINQGAEAQQQAQMDPLLQQKMNTADLLQNQEQQINDYTNATQQINNQTAGFYKNYNDQVSKMQSPQDIVQGYKAKDDALLQAYTDNKIDPNRFYKNESTGSRIASAIGLMLSGAGSGVTGGPNLAMQQLQRSVDNDIDAQKNEQGKNLNLYKMNQEALGNDLHAQAATQNQLWSGVQAKVAMATAQAQNPLVKLKGQEMINNIEQQKIQNRLQLGLIQGQGGQPSQPGMQGNLSSADPAVLVPMFIKDPSQQKTAYDEIGKAQNANKSYGEMLQAFDQAGSGNALKGGNTIVGSLGGVRSPESVNKLQNLGLPLIRDQDGRVNEFENEAFKKMIPKPGDTDTKIAQKRQDMVDFWRAKMAAPTTKGASGGAIDLTKFASTNLPQPSAIASMGGVQYQKVAGGWKKVATNP